METEKALDLVQKANVRTIDGKQQLSTAAVVLSDPSSMLNCVLTTAYRMN